MATAGKRDSWWRLEVKGTWALHSQKIRNPINRKKSGYSNHEKCGEQMPGKGMQEAFRGDSQSQGQQLW